jgi:glycosyltransferase involved in cell wall biosynthesis
MTNVFAENDLEILISTKNRCNFDFLDVMFPFRHFSTFNILIINQSENTSLNSDFKTVRVINSNEKGLSKSRNLAFNNASKQICLIADDDVVYSSNFDSEIINTFNNNPKSSIISFNHKRIGKNQAENTAKVLYTHSKKSIENVCSFEIAFRLKDIKEHAVRFNEDFGLGSYFETADEYLFLRDAMRQKLHILCCPSIIVSHPLFTSGDKQGSDTILFARGAVFYKTRGNLAYIWLLKYVFFLVRYKFIRWDESKRKYIIGLQGIRKYKELVKLK